MKQGIFILMFLFYTVSVAFSQITLTIEIAPLRNSDGQVLVEFNNEKEEIIKGYSEKIVENKCILVIEDLKPGKYAFKYFHDENEDEKLNTNFMGIPKEGYGFSNNAKGKFGPPNFSKMVFEVKQSDTLKCVPNYILK